MHRSFQFPGIVNWKLKFPFCLVVLLPGIGFCYSEVDQFPDIVCLKWFNFRVLLKVNCKFPGNNTQKLNNFQLMGNNTWKLTKRGNFWVNLGLSIPGHFQLPGIIPGNYFEKIRKYENKNNFKNILWCESSA